MNLEQIKKDAENGIPVGKDNVLELIKAFEELSKDHVYLTQAMVKFSQMTASYPVEVLKILKLTSKFKDLI